MANKSITVSRVVIGKAIWNMFQITRGKQKLKNIQGVAKSLKYFFLMAHLLLKVMPV